MVSLPIEVYESILDELSESPETLRACALVSHLFAQRAQKLLFSYVSLTRPTKVFKAALGIRSHVWPSMRFHHILSSSPHLAGYVKSLVISDEATLHFYREELSWIRSDNMLHRILPQLVNLEELKLEGNPRGSSLNFRKWGDSLRAGILERCSSERLVTLHLAHVRNIPLSLLALAPRLETLWLKRALFVPDDHDTKLKEKSPPAQLKHFSVIWMRSEEWHTFYPWLASHLDLTYIKILELNIDFENELEAIVEEGLQAISNLLRGCSATLETLRFFMPEESKFPFHSFNKTNPQSHLFYSSATMMNLPSQPRPFELDICSMPALRDLSLNSCIWNEGQYMTVSGTHPTPSVAQSPQTALHTLSSVVSQLLQFKTHASEHDRSSSSGSPHRQLETLTLQLDMDEFEEIASSKLENIGWEEFVTVVEALAGVGRMSLESEREAMEMDSRPMEERQVTFKVVRAFVPHPGATSVTVIVSIPGGSDEIVADLLKEKLGRLRDKGIRLTIHYTG